MLAERFLVNMFLKMTYYPGLGNFFFFVGDFVFMAHILIVILFQEIFS